MSAAHSEYALGRTQQEYARLAHQSALMEPMTRRTFTDAGIVPGMRVLDLGSGAGDVCMLLADMVGQSGSVIGLDVDASAIAHASERAAAADLRNISFVNSDVSHFAPEEPIDAIVGRFILMYQPDPSATLAALAKHLRPGGVVAFLEPSFAAMPPNETVLSRVGSCVIETLRRTGAHLDLGLRLHTVFTKAGLPLPHMRFEAVMDGAPDSHIHQYITDTYASLLPKAIQLSVPTAEGLVPLDEIPHRISVELEALGYAAFVCPMVCAWCKT